ncbi:MAG: thermosome subunit beta [Haloferacaceae archaeon]
MSQRRMAGQPVMIMGEEAQQLRDRDAQEHNISAARAVAEAVRTTLGPKGMDKMLVDSTGDVTVTNDGVTILNEMDIDNPTAEMIVEVARTQEDEAGDGTTTAVAVAGELLKQAQDLVEQDVHPTTIVRGFTDASEVARSEIEEVSTPVDGDEALLRAVAETAMTGKGAEANKEILADIVVEAVETMTVAADDGSTIVDLAFIESGTEIGPPVEESELIDGAVIDKDPVHPDMPTEVDDARVLLTLDPIEAGEPDVDASVKVTDSSQIDAFLDAEEAELEEKVEFLKELGVDVVIAQKGIDDAAHHYLKEAGILAMRRTKKSDMRFLKEVLGARVVSDLESATEEDVGRGSVEYHDDTETFRIEGHGEESHGVTMMLYGSTGAVVDEMERGVEDALDVVATAAGDGRVVPGGGAVEIEVARRLRDYADSVEGREQLAVEAFADALEIVPRTLAENGGLDAIDTLVDLRSAHDDGAVNAGLDVFTGEVVDSLETGVVEPTRSKQQAVASAAEAANLVLKIDDILDAGEGDDDEGGPGGPGGAPGGMGGMGGMGGAM